MATTNDGCRSPAANPRMPTPLPTSRSHKAASSRSHRPPGRRKMAVVRLGSRRGRGWRLLAGILRRLRLRWLVAQYRKALKKLRECQATLIKDLLEGAASMEAVRSQIILESYFGAAPFLPVTAVSQYYLR